MGQLQKINPMAWAAAYALLMPLGLGLVALWSPLGMALGSAGAAAWVQALGSIGAILAGFVVVGLQRSDVDARAAKAQRNNIHIATSLVWAAARRMEEVAKASETSATSIARAQVWKSTLSVEARSLGRFDTGTLRDVRLITIVNSVVGQIEYAGVCIDSAINAVELRNGRPIKIDLGEWQELSRKLRRRVSNIETRISEMINITYPEHDHNGPVLVEPATVDDSDLQELA